MRKHGLILLAMLGLLPGIPKAQNTPAVTVTVHSAGQPLPYAYVFLNRSLYAATDSLGRALLPASDLKQGDTLTFNYIGSREALLVYDGKPTYRVEVEAVRLDAVVVTAPRKVVLGEDIKTVQIVNWYEELRGEVRMELPTEEHSPRQFAGQFLLVCLPGPNYATRKEFAILELSPEAGSDPFIPYFHEMLWQAVVLPHTHPRSFLNQNVQIRYEGLSDGLEVYTILRPFYRNKANYQLRFYVDPQAKTVRRLSYYAVSADNNVTQLTADYTLAAQGTRIYPTRLEAVITDPYGKTLFACSVSNTTLSPPLPKKYLDERKRLLNALKTKKTD